MAVRLPRAAAALLVGAALSVAGSTYQNLFRNPLVSPVVLGVAAGAGFGASLAMTLHLSALVVQVAAFSGGLLAVGLSTWVAQRLGKACRSCLSWPAWPFQRCFRRASQCSSI